MAKQLFGLTQKQAQRVGKLVRGNGRKPPTPAGERSGSPPPAATFWAELTAEDSSNPGQYKWKKIEIDDREFIDVDPAVDSGSDYSAIEINRAVGMVGKRVLLRFYGYDDDGAARYAFVIPTPSLVMVRITGYTSPSTLGGGKYYGRILTGKSTALANSTALTMTEGMSVPAVDNALVMNLLENNLSSHDLPINAYCIGMTAGVTSGTPSYTRVFVMGIAFSC